MGYPLQRQRTGKPNKLGVEIRILFLMEIIAAKLRIIFYLQDKLIGNKIFPLGVDYQLFFG